MTFGERRAYFGRDREPNRLPLTLLVDALIIDPRRPDRDRPRPDRHPALPRTAVADDQPLAILVNLVHERADILLDLGLERRSDHPPRALPSEIIERDRAPSSSHDGEPANI